MNARQTPCPVARTLDLIGDRWSLLIIRDLLYGRSHFKEFRASPEKIASNILADRLRRLTQHGLIESYPSPSSSGKRAYRLTEKGSSLKNLLREFAHWGLANIPETSMGDAPIPN